MASNRVASSRGKGKVHVDQVMDWISQLSDDVLLVILSSLEMKDAAKTSILSKKWRHVWTYRTDLDFDPSKIIQNWCGNASLSKIERLKYMNWVNQVLRVHRGPAINKFRIHNRFDARDTRLINTWVQFAFYKKVRELDLNVELYRSPTNYSLGFHLLKNSSCRSGISYLTSLHLRYVDVSGEFLEFLISQCQLLERLVVELSKDLMSFNINSSNKLKHLGIRRCCNLKRLVIDAANLMCFEYEDTGFCACTDVSFRNVPVLVEAALGGPCCFAPFPIFKQIACFSMQLSKLSIDLQRLHFQNPIDVPMHVIPPFSNVTHLMLAVPCDRFSSLLNATHFIEACPVLCEFTLEVDWLDGEIPRQAQELQEVSAFSDSDDYTDDDDYSEDDLELLYDLESAEDSEAEEPEDEPQYENGLAVEQEDNKTHPNLREILLDGFIGCSSDVQLLLHLADFAPALETIMCKPGKFADDDEIRASRRRTGKLSRILPPTVKKVFQLKRMWRKLYESLMSLKDELEITTITI